jgi:hypothetical protein
MGFKQRRINPGTDYIAATAVRYRATEAIGAGDIICVTGTNGALPTCELATGADLTKSRGRLLVAKHAVPAASDQGIGLPWRRIAFLTTGAAVGDPIWLTTAGQYALAPNATNAIQRIVGRVVTVGTATTGRIDLTPAESQPVPADGDGILGGSPVIYRFVLGATEAKTVTVPVDFTICEIHALKVTAAGGASAVVDITNDGNEVVVGGIDLNVSDAVTVRAATMDDSEVTVDAGDDLVVTTSAGTDASCVLTVIGITGA